MMVHESIHNHYKVNTKLIIDFRMSLAELEDMIPFEREVYVALIEQLLEKKAQANGIT